MADLKDVCSAFPHKRKGGDVAYRMADIGLSAFSLFFMQGDSFLSCPPSACIRPKNQTCADSGIALKAAREKSLHQAT